MKLLIVYDNSNDRDGLSSAAEKTAEVLRMRGPEVEIFTPLKTKDQICSGCGACKGAGMCVFDPRGKEFMKAAEQSDAFLFAAHGGILGLNVEVKNILEQAASLAKRRGKDPLCGKPAAALLICRRGGRSAAKQMSSLLDKCGFNLPSGKDPEVIREDPPETSETLHKLAQLLADDL